MVEGTFIWATWKRISGMEGVHRSGYSGVQLSTATIIRQKLGYGLLTRTHTHTHTYSVEKHPQVGWLYAG